MLVAGWMDWDMGVVSGGVVQCNAAVACTACSILKSAVPCTDDPTERAVWGDRLGALILRCTQYTH